MSPFSVVLCPEKFTLMSGFLDLIFIFQTLHENKDENQEKDSKAVEYTLDNTHC